MPQGMFQSKMSWSLILLLEKVLFCNRQVYLHSTNNGRRWAGCCFDEDDQTTSFDDRENHSVKAHDKALALMDHVESIEDFAVEYIIYDHVEKDAKFLIEQKLIGVAGILVISMEGHIGDLRKVINEMVEETEGKCKGGNQSWKKSKAQRELDKLTCSINYDRPAGENYSGVKLLKL